MADLIVQTVSAKFLIADFDIKDSTETREKNRTQTSTPFLQPDDEFI